MATKKLQCLPAETKRADLRIKPNKRKDKISTRIELFSTHGMK
jgi:hypothetical protein